MQPEEISRQPKKSQAASQILAYTNLLSEMNSILSSENKGSQYSGRASTPSASSSPNEDEDNQTTFHYLAHNNGDSYEYKLKSTDSSRWIVSGHDVSSIFIDYRNATIKKAKDLEKLNDSEQLALDGIMLLNNDFVNSAVAPHQVADAIMKEVDEIAYCQPVKLEKSYQNFLVKFCEDMCARYINTSTIRADIRKFRQDEADAVCDILTNLLNTYSADYSSDNVNEATLVRDTIDNFLKAYSPIPH